MTYSAQGHKAKFFKLIQQLAQKQIEDSGRVQVATLVTEPSLKYIAGPNATKPFEPGDKPGDSTDAVLAWFADIRLDSGNAFVKDAIVPTQARGNIGNIGSPVTVYKDPSTGAYQIIGRADRTTSFQSVKTYTTKELGLGYLDGDNDDLTVDIPLDEAAYKNMMVGDFIGIGFVKGHRLAKLDTTPGSQLSVVSAFYQYWPALKAVLDTPDIQGHKEAGLNRGIKSFNAFGDPQTNYTLETKIEKIPYGSLVYGTDGYGVFNEIATKFDGTTEITRRNE